MGALVDQMQAAILSEREFSERFTGWSRRCPDGKGDDTTTRAFTLAYDIADASGFTDIGSDAAVTAASCWALLGLCYRESWFGPALGIDGSGDHGNGWDEPQIDIHAHPDDVAKLRALPFGSRQRRRLALQTG